MSTVLAKRLLFGVAFFFAFPLIAGQYPDKAKSTRTTVTVHVVWLPDFEATSKMCGWLMGGGPADPNLTTVGCYNPQTNTIYAVEPRNFNDAFRLEILGHEFWHALGAEHPEI